VAKNNVIEEKKRLTQKKANSPNPTTRRLTPARRVLVNPTKI
jgi:hypothetical protein